MRIARRFSSFGLAIAACLFSFAAAEEPNELPNEISEEQRAKLVASTDVAMSASSCLTRCGSQRREV